MKKLALFGVIVTAFTLVSCGGSTQIPSDIVLPGSAQSTLSTPTYGTGTEELAAFNAINSFRLSVGLGYWQQNVFLDASAKNHMNYSIANTEGVLSPFQNDIEVQYTNGVQNTYFTGIQPSARAIAVGYYYLANTITEFNVPTNAVGEIYSTGPGVDVVNAMVNTIYHRSALMTQATVDMGLARDTTGTISPNATTPTHWWINHGRLTSTQSVASNYMVNYPLDQQTNIPLYMDAEYPSVFINKPNFDFTTQTSSPISLTLSTSQNLTITSFTVTQAGTGVALGGTVWSMANDPNLDTSEYSTATLNVNDPPAPVPTLAGNEAYWVGNAPFLPNTTYNVYVTGTTFLIPYGITNPFTRSWSFTTGT